MRASALHMALLPALLLGCGRTALMEADAGSARVEAGTVADAGPLDAGTADAGHIERCPHARDAGSVVGQTPLGPIDFRFVWVGSEPPGSHSCPHVTVHASNRLPGEPGAALLAVDFWRPMSDGLATGSAILTVGAQTVTAAATGKILRADGMFGVAGPEETWRTQLMFEVSDGGWQVRGVVDTLECLDSTWRCL